MSSAMKWLVAYTQPRGESVADRHLQNQGFAVYLPRYLKRRRHARRTDWVAAPLFPRYLFVGIDPARSRWRSIISTIGVAGLVWQGEEPAAVPADVLRAIRERENTDGYVGISNSPKFRPGDAIRIAEGALAGLTGIFECARDEQRVMVLLDLLGRKARVETPLHAVCLSA